MFRRVTAYSPLWWTAVALGAASVLGFGAGLGFGVTIFLTLVYGLVGLVRLFEHYPFEFAVTWYVAVLGLFVAATVALMLLCGLFWVLRRLEIFDEDIC